ncbi:MAG TPA: hypothetical protein VJT08_01320 [Terriglobales bacterium]|nr:hypothetical protein [Acidobacteriaceae bacterium]HKR29083.1 hypothetical protein [Terriglobales bacterium]
MRVFIYHYNHHEQEEVEEEPTGKKETPGIGTIVNRNGKDRKVAHVIAPVTLNGSIPIVRVFLTDRVKERPQTVKHLPS